MYAKPAPSAGTPATADAVSCEPTAVTGSGQVPTPAPPRTSPSTVPRTSPTRLPGWHSGGNKPGGIPAPVIRVVAQARAGPSRSPVVDALVISAPASHHPGRLAGHQERSP